MQLKKTENVSWSDAGACLCVVFISCMGLNVRSSCNVGEWLRDEHWKRGRKIKRKTDADRETYTKRGS